MPRSKLDTLIYATILLTPMAVAAGYIALAPVPAPVVIVEPAACPEPAASCPEPVAVCTEPPPAAAPEPASEPAPSTPIAPPNPAGAGMLIFDHQLVLTTGPDLTWSKGQLRDHPIEWGVAVSKRVDPARLPAPLRALADARIVVYAADGSSCTASTRPDALAIYGRQDGELAYPEDENEELTPAQRLAVRQDVFAEAQLLRARLHRDGPRCDGLWARDAALPAPAVFAASDASEGDPALRERVLAELTSLPRIADLARAYRQHGRDSGGDQPAWTTYLRESLQVTRWNELGGTRSYLNVIVGDGGEACSDLFSDQVATLFRVDGDALLALDQPGFLDPLAIMDLERDGQLEAVTRSGWQLETAAGTLQSFEIPYHGCPC